MPTYQDAFVVAQAIEVWMSLAVNTWILATAIIVVVRSAFARHTVRAILGTSAAAGVVLAITLVSAAILNEETRNAVMTASVSDYVAVKLQHDAAAARVDAAEAKITSVRMATLNVLRDIYIRTHNAPETFWPPEAWVNEQLARYGADWRVQINGITVMFFPAPKSPIR